ncbi:MAG: bacteriocin family protein [Pseudonocardia sp.]|uniref:family 1 encapsulin nanocompartment shell protein n=1 Tax=unclassified Pseudonocardia TaxID=2619320 RepID=UPI00086F140B|nr:MULTISPECIES: family 1 encapsulin nanocompartment shell protein [unclassified Pseudonocardia]MBN9108037.1 bacteriocin family protein [Pseudonocardia sp.]ODU24721.1 MAG: bacteriocin [Pseudonocardia sp. SCN 72-51]ODV04905.1 MAG: bacteriocin [Pseudonocardia sp. SCN 73-27]
MTTPADHLLRGLAPVPAEAWKQIDDEARERLTPLLAGRRIVDFDGPGGWFHSATSLGRTEDLLAPPEGVTSDGVRTRRRRVLPLAEVRVPFTVARAEIDDIQRGAADPEFDDLARAARVAAEIENRAILHGWAAAGIEGLGAVSPYPAMTLGSDCNAYPGIVARAVDTLRRNGIEGPYSLIIGPEGYTRIVETTEHGGYLLFDHLARILGGSIIWAPGTEGAIVASTRGGDFRLDVGQDLSIGYSHHDADTVHLYLEESFSFRVVEPDAALALS